MDNAHEILRLTGFAEEMFRVTDNANVSLEETESDG
jgi:hypothetical protein